MPSRNTDPSLPPPPSSLPDVDAYRPLITKLSVSQSFTGDKLDHAKSNWTAWSTKILIKLALNGLKGYIMGTASCPLATSKPHAHANWLHNDELAFNFILDNIEDREQTLVITKKMAKECWDTLEQRHVQEGPMRQLQLIQEAMSICCSTTESLVITGTKLYELAKWALAMGPLTLDVVTSLYILNSLTTFPHLHTTINHNISSSTKDAPYTATAILQLLENEQRLLDADQSSTASTSIALIAKNVPRLLCSNCKRTTHTVEYCVAPGGGMAGKLIEESKQAKRDTREAKHNKLSKSDKPASSKGKIPVWVQGADGHALIAYINESELKADTDTKPEFAGLASDNLDSIPTSPTTIEYHGFMALEEEVKVSIDWNTKSWTPDIAALSISPHQPVDHTLSLDPHPFYCNTGATVHISPNKNDFFNLCSISSCPVKGIGGSSISTIGRGDIWLCIEGINLILKDALYIPASTVCLISVSSLTRKSRVRITFGDDEDGCWITDKSTGALIARGTLTTRNLYALNLNGAKVEHAYSAMYAPNLKTWHRHLGHANYQAIMDMVRNGTINGAPPSLLSHTPPKCDACVLGKQTRSPIPKRHKEKNKATRRLEIVWVDLARPEDVESKMGNYYIMNIVDDYTHYPWSIPLHTKDQAYKELRAWELARENETGLKIRTYCTDNGELKSNEMEAWLKSRGVQHQFSAPHTSAHIGRVERLHRTLMGKAVTMRTYANLPPFLWDNLYLTATHLHSKTTSLVLWGKTPHELWYGKKPDYDYMHEIGCRAFVLVQNKHNPKIYERSIECVLIGYDTRSKTYRCYHRASRKVISSFHVQFLESHHGHMPDTGSIVPTASVPPTPASSPSAPTLEAAPAIPPIQEEDFPFDPSITPVGTLPAEPLIPQEGCPDPHPTPIDPPSAVEPPRHSNRITSNDPKPSRMDQIREESKASAERISKAQKNGRPAFWEYINIAEMFGPDTDAAFKAVALYQSPPDLLDLVLHVQANDEPGTWEEAMSSPNSDKWLAAYQEELKSLKEMNVYKLVPPSDVPSTQRICKGKPVFRVKRDENGNIVRWKIRHVFKGFEQVFSRDYTKTTSPTARMESWHIILHIAACLDWDIQQIDVKTAFLYGLLPDDEIQYMEQPRGFEEPGQENWVWRLERSLYGMKQSGCIWNQTLNNSMLSWGFTCLSAENCVYYHKRPTGTTIAVVHVDDFLSVSSLKEENKAFKEQMKDKWTISELGEAWFCVGIAISRNCRNHTIHLSQTALIDKLVAQFGQSDANPVATPMDPGLKLCRIDSSTLSNDERVDLEKLPYRSLIGGLIYVAIGTHANIAYAVQQLSQFLDCYTLIHWNAAIQVLRYLKGSRTFWLVLGGTNAILLLGFSDSDWANCPDSRRSVGGYTFSLGSGVTSWSARKQKTVAVSSCEAEYMAAFEASKEALWIWQLLDGIGLSPSTSTPIMCDNNAARAISEDPLLHARVKHMDIKYHFLQENTHAGNIVLQHISTKDNIADILTKPLEHQKFLRLCTFLGLHDAPWSMRGGDIVLRRSVEMRHSPQCRLSNSHVLWRALHINSLNALQHCSFFLSPPLPPITIH